MRRRLLVDRAALEGAQLAGDVSPATGSLLDAFRTDVRPLCAKVRLDLGAAEDPFSAFRAGGYASACSRGAAGGDGSRVALTIVHLRTGPRRWR